MSPVPPSNEEPIGLLATAVYLPNGRMSAEEIAARTGGRWSAEAVRDKLGVVQKAIPGPDDGAQEMGVRAARRCIERAGIDPMEIDVVLCVGDELREYPMTTSGIYIQEKIGARRAWAVDVMQKCSSFAAGLRLARGLLRTEPRTRTVLLAGGYRNGDLVDYTNPRVSFLYNLAAGGGAALLRRGHDENELVGISLRSDGALARHVVARHGGTADPITPENARAAERCLDVTDPAGMRQLLGERSHANFLRVIREATAEAGASPRDIDFLAVLHMKRSAHHALLADCGLRPEQSVYLSHYGHIGQFDQLLSLELAREQGKLHDGALAVGVGAGIGYSWGAFALRWGRRETTSGRVAA